MKKLCIISLLLSSGCAGNFKKGIKAHVLVQNYLEAVYGRKQVTGETVVDDILVKDYLNQSKQKQFQVYLTADLNLSVEKWTIFSQKVDSALSADRRCAGGIIAIDSYIIKDTKYTNAFIVDSTSTTILGDIPVPAIVR